MQIIEDNLFLERIKRRIINHTDIKDEILKSKRYYDNKNDIVDTGVAIKKEDGKDPLRNADNRISHNLHEILVDERAAYIFTYPVLFDIDGNKELNENIKELLGDGFERKSKNLCIEADNCGTAWLHYWIDESNEEDVKFKYELVNTEEIIPIYDNGLERKLEAVIRYFSVIEEVEGVLEPQMFVYVEYWTEDRYITWKFKDSIYGAIINEECGSVDHTLEAVPFIEFANNKKKSSGLSKYKSLLDLKDRVMSGFANDLEDIQQIIYILEDYGGADMKEFKDELKRYKTVKLESEGDLRTLQIEIPVEARKVILEELKEQIYESGQGLQQNSENFGNATGVALRFFYRKLELKSGLLETEFRTSYNALIKAMLKFLGEDTNVNIIQTWTRNMISNDLETAQIAQMSKGIISDRTIVKNHPWTEDVETEINQVDEDNKIENNYTNFNMNEIKEDGEVNE